MSPQFDAPNNSRILFESRRLPLTLLGVGLFLVAGSVLAGRYSPRSTLPGKLVPRQELLTWKSPSTESESSQSSVMLDGAKATFEIENVGGSPVRIKEVESSCGCATPKVEPKLLASGEIGVVEVRALPIEIGERIVTVTLTTDSPLSPKVVLQLRIIGGRRPPFMGTADGDLNFEGHFTAAEIRTIYANCVEMAGSNPTPPVVKGDLPFVEIGPAKLLMESAGGEAEYVVRKYAIETKIVTAPPLGSFAGQVSVTDPWDGRHVRHIPVRGEVLPPVRVIPSRLILGLQNDREKPEGATKILVLLRDRTDDLDARFSGGEEVPLNLGRAEMSEDGRRASMSISLKSGAVKNGEFELVIGPSSASDRVVVPISIRVEKPR